MVASIMAYSLSGSSAKVLKRLSQTPLAAQREKRLWMFFQSPKRSGKSRHGAPERNFKSPPRQTGGCQARCYGQPCRDAPVEESQSAQTGRRAIHSASSQSPLKEGSL